MQLRETFRFMLEHPTAESIFPHNKVRARSIPDQHMLSVSLPSWAPIGLLAHERCSLGPLRQLLWSNNLITAEVPEPARTLPQHALVLLHVHTTVQFACSRCGCGGNVATLSNAQTKTLRTRHRVSLRVRASCTRCGARCRCSSLCLTADGGPLRLFQTGAAASLRHRSFGPAFPALQRFGRAA